MIRYEDLNADLPRAVSEILGLFRLEVQPTVEELLRAQEPHVGCGETDDVFLSLMHF